MVLYALLIPILFLFVGLGIDLGWYFLNVSRLQNAADAAALAGAWKLVEVDEDYWPVALSKPPTDLQEYNVFYVWNGTTNKYDKKDITKTAVLEGKAEAIFYANKNLISVGTDNIDNERNDLSKEKVSNEWSTKENLRNVKIETTLYGKVMDIAYEDKYDISSSGTKYYKVTLTERIAHLFLSGFEPMDATVVSYVMLTPHDKSLVESIKPLEETKTIHNWEYQDKFHNFTGNWNHYRQSVDSSDEGKNGVKNIVYQTGDNFRTETITITPEKNKTKSIVETSANGGKSFDMDDTDSINIDFNQDFKVKNKNYITYDWDLRSPKDDNIEYMGMKGWSDEHGYDLRIQGLFNFTGAWDNRKLKDADIYNDLEADVMWTRIESEPMWSKNVPWGNQDTLTSVHQIIINAHESNAEVVDTGLKDSDGNAFKAYKKRPFFFFYTGPEINEPDKQDNIRESQPVILNLYEDWNAILYMPNSPVIINGNGHKLTGFVIAKEYRRLKEAADFLREGYIQVTDAYDHTIFVKNDNHLLTEEQFNTLVADNEYTTTVYSNATVFLYEKIEAPQRYLIIDARHVKGLSGYEDEYIKTLKAYKNITDAETVKITFPRDEDTFGGYNNTATYTVAKKDLSDTQQDGYVEVTVEGETSPKYIAKTNLPYVRIYRKDGNDLYPYVPVCDLRVKTTTYTENAGGKHPYGYAGVTLADDDHDVYKNGDAQSTLNEYLVDDKKDTWKVERTVLADYQNTYKKSGEIIKTVDSTAGRYFILKSEIKTEPEKVAEYTKLIMPNGDIRYVKEEVNAYYVQIVPEGSYKTDNSGNIIESNPIIIDNKGDLQSVLLDVSKVTRAPKDPEEIPRDRGQVIDGKYRRTSTASRDRDYRIPEYEVVYDAKKAFNLSPTSCYSYFHIEELVRVNYLYLNNDELNHTPADNWDVKDMFFTTKRADWID